MAESRADQITRLQLMAGGDPKWDLSPNDRYAIAVALDALKSNCIERCPDTVVPDAPCAECPYKGRG